MRSKGRESRVTRRIHVGHLALVYPRAGGAERREGKHVNKLALYLKQLLGIAVTHTDEDRVHIAGPKQNGRECAVRGVESWRMPEDGGAKEAKANAPRKEIKEPRHTRHFEFSAPAGRAAGATGPVSGQSVDKRVVRTVLNRSEYLYAGILPSHLFCRCRRRRFTSSFHLQVSPAVSS